MHNKKRKILNINIITSVTKITTNIVYTDNYRAKQSNKTMTVAAKVPLGKIRVAVAF